MTESFVFWFSFLVLAGLWLGLPGLAGWAGLGWLVLAGLLGWRPSGLGWAGWLLGWLLGWAGLVLTESFDRKFQLLLLVFGFGGPGLAKQDLRCRGIQFLFILSCGV